MWIAPLFTPQPPKGGVCECKTSVWVVLQLRVSAVACPFKGWGCGGPNGQMP